MKAMQYQMFRVFRDRRSQCRQANCPFFQIIAVTDDPVRFAFRICFTRFARVSWAERARFVHARTRKLDGRT